MGEGVIIVLFDMIPLLSTKLWTFVRHPLCCRTRAHNTIEWFLGILNKELCLEHIASFYNKVSHSLPLNRPLAKNTEQAANKTQKER